MYTVVTKEIDDQRTQTAFVFLRGTLVKPPSFRGDGRLATLLVKHGKSRIPVKLHGPARVESVQGWQAGDQVVAMGNLESRFSTRHRLHLLYVRAIIAIKQEIDDNHKWEEFDLSVMLGRIYRKLAEDSE